MGCLLVSDIPNDRILRWTEPGGISVFRQPSGFANGHARDMQGRLIGCSHHDRCITRTEYDGTVTTLVTHYEGKRLNSPNDVIVKSDGTIWFSDPTYGIETDYEGGKQIAELPTAVYCFNPDNDSLTLVASGLDQPNGLCFSPDERILYVAETGSRFAATPTHNIWAYDVSPRPEPLAGQRLFHKINPGHSDGVRCDEHGNVWSAAEDGVHCIAPDGRLLGKVLVPHTVSNLEFGGRNRSRLFICGSHTLYAIYLNVRGARRP